MFLFILCTCLFVTLVLVGHSLQNGAAYAIRSSERNETGRDNFWYRVLDFATTKLFSNKHLLQFSNYRNNFTDSKANSTETPTRSTLDTSQNMSKVIQHLSWRLPREVKPKHYDLLLHPNFDSRTFSGRVSIQLDVLKPISFIPIHAKLLNISDTSVVRNSVADNSSLSVRVAQTFAHEKFEYWVTEFESPLEIGEYTISFAFSGSLLNRIVGFYGSTYKDVASNQTR